MRLRLTFLWTMIVSLSAAALIGIAALLLPRWGPTEEIIGSVMLFAAFSLVALCCAIVLEKRRLTLLMWIGITASAAALLTWLYMIWFDWTIPWQIEERVMRAGGVFSILASWTACCGLMALPRFSHPAARLVRWGSVAVWGFLATTGILSLCFEDWFEALIRAIMSVDWAARLVGALAILGACGTVLTPILWKMQAVRGIASRQSIPVKVRVQLVCPRCQTNQQLITGHGKCSHCGLRIRVDVEEPRCACGYLLYRLEGDVCPECGRTVPEEDRWAAGSAAE